MARVDHGAIYRKGAETVLTEQRAEQLAARTLELGAYERISDDQEDESTGDRGAGVSRQHEALHLLCTMLSSSGPSTWTIHRHYSDNDVSAYKDVVRPEFELLLRDLDHGVIEGIVVYDLDRHGLSVKQWPELRPSGWRHRRSTAQQEGHGLIPGHPRSSTAVSDAGGRALPDRRGCGDGELTESSSGHVRDWCHRATATASFDRGCAGHRLLRRGRARVCRPPGPAPPTGSHGCRDASAPPTAGDGMRLDQGSPADGWGDPRSRTVTWWDPMIGARAMHDPSGVEYPQAMIDGLLPPAPIGGLMAMTAVSVGEGTVEFRCQPDESAYNPLGLVHGGLVCTLLDSVTRCAGSEPAPP